jgi:hypothetical protein
LQFFFALAEENSNTTSRIYAIMPSKEIFIDPDEYDSPFQVKGIKFLYPPVSTNRIELQKGIFSIHAQLDISV